MNTMRKCPNCESNIADPNATNCNVCGTVLPVPQYNAQPNPGAYNNQPGYGQPNPGAYNNQPGYSQPNPGAYNNQPGYRAAYTYDPMDFTGRMKWHNFLIYFSLFASAVMNVLNAILMFSGNIWDMSAPAGYGDGFYELVYQVWPGIQSLDMFYGVGCLVLAALSVVARFQLAGFKKSGPNILTILYALNLILSVIYLVGLSAISGEASASSGIGGSVAVSIAMIVANSTYYNKRKHMCVN